MDTNAAILIVIAEERQRRYEAEKRLAEALAELQRVSERCQMLDDQLKYAASASMAEASEPEQGGTNGG